MSNDARMSSGENEVHKFMTNPFLLDNNQMNNLHLNVPRSIIGLSNVLKLCVD